MILRVMFFFFNDTASTEIYTLSLHDALPICQNGEAIDRESNTPSEVAVAAVKTSEGEIGTQADPPASPAPPDRKSTRLNSSHSQISYAVFCLKKKTNTKPVILTHTNIHHQCK